MSTRASYPANLALPAASDAHSVNEPIRWRDILAAAIEQVMVWHERARQRRQLQTLSDHMLHDIGLGRGDVAAETSKPFWRP
jgi:uncharacterized protein YjiS (DUF1127 family)